MYMYSVYCIVHMFNYVYAINLSQMVIMHLHNVRRCMGDRVCVNVAQLHVHVRTYYNEQ